MVGRPGTASRADAVVWEQIGAWAAGTRQVHSGSLGGELAPESPGLGPDKPPQVSGVAEVEGCADGRTDSGWVDA